MAYIEKHWGSVQAFLDVYVPLDQRLRQQMEGTGDALVDRILDGTTRAVQAAGADTRGKLQDLELYVRDHLGSQATAAALKDQLHALTESTRTAFTDRLVHYLKSTDNDTMVHRLERISNTCHANKCELDQFRAQVQTILTEVRTLSGLRQPVAAILDQVTLHKSKQSSRVGHDAQQRFEVALTAAFLQHNVEPVHGAASKTDFILSKDGAPDVLVELKDWTGNVSTRDVVKFESNVKSNARHGVMVSMRSGVVDRKDFEFRIIDNRNIALYLLQVEWDMTRVTAAVQLIYCLEHILRAADSEGNYFAFTPELIDSLNGDLATYDSRLREGVALLDKTKGILSSIMLDSIRNRLATGLRTQPKQEPTIKPGQCCFCQQVRPSWENSSNLNAHVKACKRNPENITTDS